MAERIEFVRVVDGPIQALDLQNGVGTVSTLGQIVRVEIDSIITDFNGLGDFTLNGQPVNAANATRADMSGLAPGNGVRVEVEGELRSGVVVAESLAERPPASIRFDAVVDSVFANGFSLLGVDAQVQPTTQYLDENLRTFRIGDLSPGDYVSAQGFVSTAGQLMVTRLQRQDAVSESQARGHVDSFNPKNFPWLAAGSARWGFIPRWVKFKLNFLQIIREPARLAGTILLVHETMNQVEETRRAWLYNSGSRRVRRAPNVGYDNPATASDGLRTNDQLDMFNGAMDRYSWKLVGKKEIYIPYNAYRIHSPELKYTDIIKPRHINMDLTRYEKHRVWIVEASIREGTSHLFQERTFYVDEDSWQIALVDNYDRRGELWRVQEGHQIQVFDPKYYVTQAIVAHTIYDLQNSRYITLALSNEDDEYTQIDDEIENPRNYFNPRSISRFAFK